MSHWNWICRISTGIVKQNLHLKPKTECFLKWWYPQNIPKWSFLVGKPWLLGYHNFRKPPTELKKMIPQKITSIYLFSKEHQVPSTSMLMWKTAVGNFSRAFITGKFGEDENLAFGVWLKGKPGNLQKFTPWKKSLEKTSWVEFSCCESFFAVKLTHRKTSQMVRILWSAIDVEQRVSWVLRMLEEQKDNKDTGSCRASKLCS